jgi:cell cycle sensor histidine kinase DivJ
VWSYIEELVHPYARQDALTAARHRAFIAPRLLGSFVALAAIPVYLFMRGTPSALEFGVFAWLVVPMTVAYFLSRTGRYQGAHVLSSIALTGLVTAVAWQTGGIKSFAAIWLVVVPLEAALSASRRVIVLASSVALAAAGLLLFVTAAGLLPAAAVGVSSGAWAALGIISAVLYAIGLALSAESHARTSVWLLNAEEDRYRLLAGNMTDVITRHRSNGDVLFVSPAAESVFGAAADRLIGHGLFDRVHVADRPAYLSALADAAALGVARSIEFRARRDSAGPGGAGFVWLEMRCQPLVRTAVSVGNARQDVVAVLRDISERKNYESELEQVRAESDRANAGKSRFLATMSHELRTPLNAIIGFSEMMTDPTITLDSDRARDYARLINDSGRHLLSVVNGILDMSKMEAGNFEITREPFAPAPAISGCCDLLALKAHEAGIELRTNLALDLPEITADRRALNQILINLISNAIKFTDSGGSVTVAAEQDGANLLVKVVDTGVGIGEDDLAHVGEPFFQARATYSRRHDGTGLGLSIVKGLVRLHGGKLDIDSRLGVGTCVAVRLPFDQGDYHAASSPIVFARRNVAIADQPDGAKPVKKSA